MPASEKIIRFKTAFARTGLSRSARYRKIDEGTFSPQLKISVHGAGWHESAIKRWIAETHKRKSVALTETLEDRNLRLDTSSDIRSLVGKIVLHSDAGRGEVNAILHGSFMGILDFASDHSHLRVIRGITKWPRLRGNTDVIVH